jgi:Domain of unknown function (DUF5668)
MNGTNGNWVNAIRGPVTLITVGALFVLNNFTGIGFEKTWPVLLIVFGLLSLLRRSMAPPPAPPPVTFPPPTYTYTPPQYNPPPSQPGGSYAGSSYSQPAPRGGFGSTAPAKPESGENTPSSGGVA